MGLARQKASLLLGLRRCPQRRNLLLEPINDLSSREGLQHARMRFELLRPSAEVGKAIQLRDQRLGQKVALLRNEIESQNERGCDDFGHGEVFASLETRIYQHPAPYPVRSKKRKVIPQRMASHPPTKAQSPSPSSSPTRPTSPPSRPLNPAS